MPRRCVRDFLSSGRAEYKVMSNTGKAAMKKVHISWQGADTLVSPKFRRYGLRRLISDTSWRCCAALHKGEASRPYAEEALPFWPEL